jgi:hypothetical protein
MAKMTEVQLLRAAHLARGILIMLNLRIVDSWYSNGVPNIPGWCRFAKPWLRAIADQDYGVEDPHSAILYALNALTKWRGEDAKRFKLQFNQLLEELK